MKFKILLPANLESIHVSGPIIRNKTKADGPEEANKPKATMPSLSETSNAPEIG